jgi:WD40 repeat protein
MSPDGLWWVAGQDNGTLKVWRRQAGAQQVPVSVCAHRGPILAAAVSRDGRFLVTGAADRTARIWDLHNPTPWNSPTVLSGHTGGVSLVAISNDGHRVVTAGHHNIPRYWNVTPGASATPTLLRKIEDTISWLELSPDGRWLVSGGDWAYASLCDLSAANPSASYAILPSSGGPVGIALFSPDSKQIVTATGMASEELRRDEAPETVLRVWDISSATPRVSVELKGHTDVILDAVFLRNGEFLATASFDGTVRVWQPKGDNPPEPLYILRGDNEPVFHMAGTSDGQWLATESTDGTARLWSLTDESPVAAPIRMSSNRPATLSASADGRWLFQGDSNFELWDLHQSRPSISGERLEASTASKPVKSALSQNGRFLVLGYGGENDKALLVVDLHRGLRVAPGMFVPTATRDIVGFGLTDRWLLVNLRNGSNAEDLALWDLSAQPPRNTAAELGIPTTGVSATALSAFGALLAVAQTDGTVGLTKLPEGTGSARTSVSNSNGTITELEFSPQGHWIIGHDERDGGRTLKLWKISNGAIVPSATVLTGHTKNIEEFSVSPDEHWLATGAFGESMLIWNLRAADLSRPALVIPMKSSISVTATFSADGRWLATTSYEGATQLWDLSLGHNSTSHPVTLRGHSEHLVRLAFSPDSHWLISADTNAEPEQDAAKTCRIWDLKSPDPADSSIVLPRGDLPFGADAINISADGHWLITSSMDGVRLWPLGTQELIRLAERTVGRALNEAERKVYSVPVSPPH